MKTNFLNYLLLILLLPIMYVPQQLKAQCPPGDNEGNLEFFSQEDVDNFIANYPNCTELQANLILLSDDINDLSPFSNLQSIEGNFESYSNDGIQNLDALSNLQYLGGNLYLSFNNNLENIDGLSGLKTIDGSITIISNSLLKNINGLSGVEEVGGDVDLGGIELENIDGLTSLRSIGGDLLIDRLRGVQSINGFASLETIGGNVWIAYNSSLQYLGGFQNLQSVGEDLDFVAVGSLSSIDGFRNLSSVGRDFSVRSHDNLTNLDNFSNLTSVGGEIEITNNSQLTSFNGICPVFIGGFDENNFIQENNAAVFDPAICTACPDGDVALSSQQDIEDYAANYPFCVDIAGNLTIQGDDITDLSLLSNLESITGDLIIQGTGLINLNTFSNLHTISGNLQIEDNASLETIDDFSSLTSFSGFIQFELNTSLTTLNGFDNLTDVFSLYIIRNPYIETLGAFANLETIGKTLFFGFFNIESLSSFSKITTIGDDLVLEEIGLIKNMDDFSMLTSIGGNLGLARNSSLENLDGLSGLVEVGQRVDIRNNSSLTNFDGLCPLFNAGFDPANLDQQSNGAVFEPANCSLPCEIMSVTAGDAMNCDPNTDTYDRDLTIVYQGSNLTESFMVSVNGGDPISYPLTSLNSQTILLIGLPSDGQEVDIEVYISDVTACSLAALNLFQNPLNCGQNPTGDCDITDLTVADQSCNYNNGTYDQDLVLTYTNAPATGSILLKANNQSGWETFPITGSPQILTLPGRTSGEGTVDIFVKFSDDNGCTFYVTELFTAPTECVLPCTITAISTGNQTACDPATNTYSQELMVVYENAPNNGSLMVGGQAFGITGSPQMVTLNNLPADGNEVDVTAYFSDNNSCQLTESDLFTAPDACSTSPSGDGSILFVVKQASDMDEGDRAVKAQLENTGYMVMVMSQNDVESSDATGKDLVLISNTVYASTINTTFTDVAVPVVCYESQLYDDLGMTGGSNGSDYGQDSNEETIDIDNAGHPMAAGLSGEPQVYSGDGSVIWGKPNNNAIKVASTQGGYSGQWTIFGYETGASMVSGTAPARRASLFFKESQVDKLTANGWALFDAVICWAAGCQTARFAPQIHTIPQIKAYPNPFQNNITIEWKGTTQEVSLSLINLMGQQVYGQQLRLQSRHQLAIGDLPTGIYILQVVGANFKQEMKVVKE